MRVIMLSEDLMMSSSALSFAGPDVEFVSVSTVEDTLSQVVDGCRIIVDLSHSRYDMPSLVEQARTNANQVEIVAFAPHVMKTVIAQAEDAGCDAVRSRGAFNRAMKSWVNGDLIE